MPISDRLAQLGSGVFARNDRRKAAYLGRAGAPASGLPPLLDLSLGSTDLLPPAVAIEAMAASPDPGTPTLRITLDTISADPSVNGDPAGEPHGPIVRLRLADSGPGFQQSDAGLPLASRKPNGSGLGLFVVRTTMRNHGGALRIGRSTELGGAEVELLWPASPATAAALSSPAAG